MGFACRTAGLSLPDLIGDCRLEKGVIAAIVVVVVPVASFVLWRYFARRAEERSLGFLPTQWETEASPSAETSALDPDLRRAILSTHTMVQELQRRFQESTQDLKARNVQFESQKSALNEIISGL